MVEQHFIDLFHCSWRALVDRQTSDCLSNPREAGNSQKQCWPSGGRNPQGKESIPLPPGTGTSCPAPEVRVFLRPFRTGPVPAPSRANQAVRQSTQLSSIQQYSLLSSASKRLRPQPLGLLVEQKVLFKNSCHLRLHSAIQNDEKANGCTSTSGTERNDASHHQRASRGSNL